MSFESDGGICGGFLNLDFDVILYSPFKQPIEVRDHLGTKKQSFIDWVNVVVDQHLGDIDSFWVYMLPFK